MPFVLFMLEEAMAGGMVRCGKPDPRAAPLTPHACC